MESELLLPPFAVVLLNIGHQGHHKWGEGSMPCQGFESEPNLSGAKRANHYTIWVARFPLKQYFETRYY